VLSRFYKELIRLRKSWPPLASLSKEQMEVAALDESQTLFMRRWSGEAEAGVAFNFGDREASACLPVPAGRWRRLLDSAEERWQGPGTKTPEEFESKGDVELVLQPHSFVLFAKEHPA